MRAIAGRIVERIRDWLARRRPSSSIDYDTLDAMRLGTPGNKITQPGDVRRSIRIRRNDSRKI